MIEILIALLIVGIITVTLMSFINDYTERYRITVAQTDLNRIAQAIQLSERSFEERVRTISEPGGSISTQLAAFLVEVPTEDPWGHRFKKDGLEILVVDRGDPEGQAYVVDEGVGRIMCAGPDAKFSTRLGQDPPDLNRDLIVNYRLQPWIAYSSQNDLWI